MQGLGYFLSLYFFAFKHEEELSSTVKEDASRIRDSEWLRAGFAEGREAARDARESSFWQCDLYSWGLLT